VLHEHVYPIQKTDPESIDQVNNIALLCHAIRSQGQTGWTTVEPTVDLYGKKMTYAFDIKDKNGSKVYRKKGDAVLKYVLTQKTESFMGATLARPIQTTRADGKLQNHLWAVNQGKTSYDNANHLPAPAPVTTMAIASASPGPNYLVSPNTSSHGVWVDQGSIKLRDYAKNPASKTKTLSINAHNYFMRSVGAYVQFFANPDFTSPIDNPTDWEEQLPAFLQAGFETNSKKYVALCSSVNSIMGIPTPTDPTVVTFNWPGNAQSAKLLFGGVGTSNWDDHIVWPGFISTGVFNFGLPILMMAAGAAITSTSWYKEFAEDAGNLLAVGSSAGFLAFGPMAGIKGLPYTLAKFGDIIGGLLVAKGMEKLAEKIILRVTAAETVEEVPFAGWAIRAASMALDAALIAVSLGEVLSSPAVIEVGLKRQMKLSFTLTPDPKHGEAGNPSTAIWPALGDNYRILVSYKNGTTFEAKGKVPLSSTGGPSSQPIKVEFTVPWGGQMSIMAGIYSKTDWLCGKLQGPWLNASPGPNTPGELDLTYPITEIVVPLTQDTQYKFKWKVAYDTTNKHYWWGPTAGATIPTATVSSISSSPVGNNIGALGGLTINRSAFVIGYVWKGSNEQVGGGGQEWVFQNLSVLEKPESRLKFPTKGFSTKPGLAYDLYGGTDKEVGPLNFVIDTSAGSNGYLRHVDIVDGKPTFGLNGATKSYGVFTLGDIDDVAIHPKGFVVAANWNTHRLQILELPTAAVPDKDAPHAVVVSNKGILEGLVQGPKALSISPDGKILVLETANQRIQAFDLKGNPAPTFTGAHLFNDTKGATYVNALDAKQAPQGLIEEFIDNRITDLFILPLALTSVLDAGVMTKQIIDAFATNMIYLTYESDGNGGVTPNPKLSSFITVIDSGRIWQITDPARDMVYHIATEGGGLQVYDLFKKTSIIILTKGTRWQLEDLTGARSYLLELDNGTLSVSEYKSFFGINPKNEQLTYCDVASEGKGYIYVLAYHGTPKGSVKNSDYIMDVYTPEGKFLFRTPDTKLSGLNMEYIAAGKIAIDYFRNLFTLNYESIAGPGGRTEPSISQWSPTPPLFELSPTDAKALDAKDVSKVVALFLAHKTTLASNSTIVVNAPNEHWTITDPTAAKTYDVFTSIKKIYVYNLPS
jgi:hypothetical protein